MSAFSGSIDVSNIINELQDLIGKGSKTSVDELTQAIERAKKAVKALKDEQERKELYTKFEQVANKYLALQRNLKDDFIRRITNEYIKRIILWQYS